MHQLVSSDQSSSSSSSLCDFYLELKSDFEYLPELKDLSLLRKRDISNSELIIVFVSPPIKINASGTYYCWATYRSKICTSPLKNIMLIKFDPNNSWAPIDLNIKVQADPATIWTDTSHYFVDESKIILFNKKISADDMKQKEHHHEINLDNSNYTIKQCTDSKIYGKFHKSKQGLFFNGLPEREQIFRTESYIKCKKEFFNLNIMKKGTD